MVKITEYETIKAKDFRMGLVPKIKRSYDTDDTPKVRIKGGFDNTVEYFKEVILPSVFFGVIGGILAWIYSVILKLNTALQEQLY